MAKAKTIKYTDGKPVEIDGGPVVYHYRLNYKDFARLTFRIAMQIRIPFEMVIVKDSESISGIQVYGKYGGEWYTTNFYNDYLIQHLLRKELEKDFQDSY